MSGLLLPQMKVYSITRTQILPVTLREAWSFFSTPKNLDRITPRQMNFKIISQTGGEKAHEGQLIRYRITVLPFIRVSWLTEITEVKEPFQFADEQRIGPYAFWRHLHRFKETNGGVEMVDEVQYAIPLGWIGQLAGWLFVHRRVNAIFDYRFQALADLFSKNTKI